MQRLSSIAFILALLALAPALRAAEKTDESDAFWRTEAVHTIHVRITPAQWQMMQPVRQQGGMLQRLAASAMRPPSTQPSTQPALVKPEKAEEAPAREGERMEPNFYGMEFAYVKADIECNGVLFKDAGFRLRGNSSFGWSREGYYRPCKIDLNRFVAGQKYMGLTAFRLNNNAYDPSRMREALGYEAFRALGVPAPRTAYVLLYLTVDGRTNRQFIGLYTAIEEPDSKAFLKRNFGSAKGLMLKPWSISGLPYFGEQWAPYDSRYNPQTDISDKTARRTIEFIKLVNYADDQTFRSVIDEYLDVDGFLRFLAGQVVLSNLDNILYTGHNFYLYLSPEDGLFHFLPWDLNLAFANFTSTGSIDQMVHLSLNHPHAGEMKLIDRLLAMPEHRDAYHGHVRRFMQTWFNSEHIAARIEALRPALAAAEAAADADWKARHTPPPTTNPTNPVPAAPIPPRPVPRLMGWQGQPAIELPEFVARRTANLRDQFAGETDGWIPGYRRAPSPPAAGLKAPQEFGSLPLVAVAVVRSADGNFDRQLSKAEAAAGLRRIFDDGNGKPRESMDEAQLTSAVASLLRRVESRDGRDRGRDWGRDRGRDRDRSADPSRPWVAVLLRGSDGAKLPQLTLQQAQAGVEAAFARFDRDKSNRLDESEIMSALDALAASLPPSPPKPGGV